MLGGLAGSAGPFQVENIFFQIADTKNRTTAFYTYTSEGVGKGLIKGLNLSATMKGPWNDFRTTQPFGFHSSKALHVSQRLVPVLGHPII